MRVLIGLFLACLASCSLNNAEEDDSVGKYFETNQLSGSFAMFNNGTGKFTMYNMAAYRDSSYPPFETANIVYALIGLETGRIKDSTALGKGGTPLPVMGSDTVRQWLDTLGYDPSRITADEQLGLVKKLYFSQLPFQPRSQRIVKNSLIKEDNSNYTLSYQIGQGQVSGGRSVIWLTGWIEENNHPYFFVLQTETKAGAGDISKKSVEILMKILRQYEFFEGRR